MAIASILRQLFYLLYMELLEAITVTVWSILSSPHLSPPPGLLVRVVTGLGEEPRHYNYNSIAL